jgi:hypothetical protein
VSVALYHSLRDVTRYRLCSLNADIRIGSNSVMVMLQIVKAQTRGKLLFNTIRIAENASLISSSIDKWDLAFAYRVTSERLIPFRSSPLEEKSLNEIADLPAQSNLHIAKSGGPRGDEIPLLFISRPDGLVIFGSGRPIRRAIQLGLWR